jgi:hypothetical protein
VAKFVSADGGVWVNLDHCATVEELHYTGKPTAWLFKNSDGNTIARLSNAREDFETAAATIWPSAPGAIALIVETFCNATYGGRPDTGDSRAAWRVQCFQRRPRAAGAFSSRRLTESSSHQKTVPTAAKRRPRRASSRTHKPTGTAITPRLTVPSVTGHERI